MATTVLNSWKQIAEYVGRGVRTVQRWERELGLPVRRPRNHLHSAVVAIPAEIDEWLRNGKLRHVTPDVDFAPRTEMKRLRTELMAGVEIMRRNIDLMHRHVEALKQNRIAAEPFLGPSGRQARI